MRHQIAILLLAIIGLGFAGLPVNAHANLIRSEPSPNEASATTPDEIRLFFTEPLEAQYSLVQLRRSDGERLDLPSAQVDSSDEKQLVLRPDNLDEGVYTVSWRVISQVDGHITQGSFPLTIGDAVPSETAQFASADAFDEAIPVDSVVVRWVNFISLALMIGAVSFYVFVWQPATTESHPTIAKRMRRLMWVAWLLAGFATGLLLLLQVSFVSGANVLTAISSPELGQVLNNTRFGDLWIMRMTAWALFGLILYLAEVHTIYYKVAFILGAGILLTQALFSHAGSAQDTQLAIGLDWLHLLAMALWVGGLAQFLNIIIPVRHIDSLLSTLVAHFSNLARVSVAILIISGSYAAWLQVGTFEALLTTVYGQSLLFKLILVLPLLAIAAVNLFFTAKGLREKRPLWSTRLRYLVIAEIALTFVILAAVSVMTAIAPARNTYTFRSASLAQQDNQPAYAETIAADDMDVQLTIEPGFVGTNDFTVTLTDDEGNPINNATRIRMRFEHQTENLGESELRPEFDTEGRYIVSGANLGITGDWQIRLTIARPDKFDSVVTFEPAISTAPPPSPPPVVDPAPSQQGRLLALLATGLLSLLAGGGLLLYQWGNWQLGPAILAGLLVLAGVAALDVGINSIGLSALGVSTSTRPNRPEIMDNAPKAIAIAFGAARPWVVTKGGDLLRPLNDDGWQRAAFDAKVQSIYMENSDTIWAATEEGLFIYADDEWQQQDDIATDNLVLTHGYMFSLGDGVVHRIAAGGILEDEERLLELPNPGAVAADFEMLGHHSHVLLNGSQVYLTSSLGLGWQSLQAPAQVQNIGVDANGNLLAASPEGLLNWNWVREQWSTIAPLPDGAVIEDIESYDLRTYVIASGHLYRLGREGWQRVNIPQAGYLADLEVRFPDMLWVADAENVALWSTSNGTDWQRFDL